MPAQHVFAVDLEWNNDNNNNKKNSTYAAREGKHDSHKLQLEHSAVLHALSMKRSRWKKKKHVEDAEQKGKDKKLRFERRFSRMKVTHSCFSVLLPPHERRDKCRTSDRFALFHHSIKSAFVFFFSFFFFFCITVCCSPFGSARSREVKAPKRKTERKN